MKTVSKILLLATVLLPGLSSIAQEFRTEKDLLGEKQIPANA